MMARKFFIYLLVMLIIVYPVSAAGVTLNRWVLNVNILDDGTVEEIIQTEIENSGPSSVDGLSFDVPASRVTNPNISTFSSKGHKVELQTAQGAVTVIINFDSPLEVGEKWNGRIDFHAENWALKSGQDYSITIPVEAPQAIVSGQKTKMSIASEPDIRSQVFLPKSVMPASVEPSVDAESRKPSYNKLLQFGHVVLTWFKLNIGDVIKVDGSYSSDLSKILDADEKLNLLSDRIRVASEQGKDVAEAEAHLSNARDYNNKALEEFWKKGNVVAALDAANIEMKLIEDSLSVKASLSLCANARHTPTPHTPAPILSKLCRVS
jgi:hypothetical protein